VGDRPADPTGRTVAQGFAVVNAQAGYRRGWWELAAQVENLLDTPWREAQFAFDSRLRSECTAPGTPRCNPPADGQRQGTVTDIHFTPGTPFTATLRWTLFLS
jgi:outer membrane receptor protein involved in Fe transport